MSNKNDNSFHIACALGFSLGAVITLALVDPDLSVFGMAIQLTDWLSFFGAALTVAGALFVARIQIDKQALIEKIRHEREDKNIAAQNERELTAARALLSYDLSTIVDYLEECATEIVHAFKVLDEGADRRQLILPDLSIDILIRLSKIIAISANQDANKLADFLSIIQVQRARLSSEIFLFNGRPRGLRQGLSQGSYNFRSTMSSMVKLYIQIEYLFDYARLDTENIPTKPYSKKLITSAYRSIGFSQINDNDIYARIEADVLSSSVEKTT